MQIIDKDDSRLIDLPGVGPCPRPVDIDESVTGFTCLKSLRIYRFQPGAVIEGESEVDEVFVIAVSGAIQLNISGASPCEATLKAATPGALYMARDHAYELTPQSETLVAYARAASNGQVPTQVVEGAESSGLAEALSYRLLTLSDGESLELGNGPEVLAHVASGALAAADARLSAGQTLGLAKGEVAKVTASGETHLLILTA